jgi:hypothetical protein
MMMDASLEVEASIPVHLRCRDALRAMVSKYKTPADADADSLTPSRNDLRLALQQHDLTHNTCSTVLTLLRRFFVEAMQAHPNDPTKSPHGEAYLAVVERSSVSDLRHPLTPPSDDRAVDAGRYAQEPLQPLSAY